MASLMYFDHASAQPAEVGEEEIHLRRRLGLGCHLEDDAHTVDGHFLSGVCDVVGWRNEARNIVRHCLAQAGVDVRIGSGWQ
jgi:hypothetical protein